ncbi:MAG: hypothetical protein HY078_16725 [Elusimicrobia bacterium]|nr:hypothetical protein [Elusimicrobiota bacterium]
MNATAVWPTLVALVLAGAELRAASEDERSRWANAGFGSPEVASLTLPPAASSARITHELPLTLVMFRNAGWTPETVRATVERTAEILSQCAIGIRRVTLVVADAPESSPDIDAPGRGRDLRIGASIPPSEKPVVFFVGKTHDGNAAWSFNRKYVELWRLDPRVLDTAWVSSEVLSASYRASRHPAYSPTAHELAHILGNRGHVEEPNILSAFSPNDRITEEQCGAFRAYELARRLRDG